MVKEYWLKTVRILQHDYSSFVRRSIQFNHHFVKNLFQIIPNDKVTYLINIRWCCSNVQKIVEKSYVMKIAFDFIRQDDWIHFFLYKIGWFPQIKRTSFSVIYIITVSWDNYFWNLWTGVKISLTPCWTIEFCYSFNGGFL